MLFRCQNTLLSALLQQHAVKLGCFRCCCTRKMFFASLQWVTLIFSWFYWKQRFGLFSAKLRCFQHYVCENSLSFFSYLNCAFNPLSHRKHVLGFFATKLEVISQKKEISFCRRKIHCFKLHSTDNMSCFVNNNIGFPWALYRKKSVSVFMLLKDAAISYIA